MHRKTQEEVLKFTGNHPEMSISQQEIQNNLLRVLNELLPYTNSFFIENLQLYKEKLLHIEKLIDKSLQNDYLDANLLLVVTKAAFYLNKTSCLEQTITLCEKVLDMSKVKNELNIEKVILENIHVKTLIQNGQYSQALEIATQKLSEHQEIASDNIELLNSFSNISIAYALLGNYKKALEYRLCSVNMHEQFPGENHTYIANSLDNLGGTYMSLGFSNLGLHYHLKSFAMREKLQQNDIEVGKSMNNIGEGYKAIKHYDEALNYISKALNVFQDKLGQSHTYTANTLSNKGEILAHQGNFDKSLKCHLEALAIRKEIFSSNPSHPHILKSLELTSQVYKTLGDIENAQKFNNEADYARGDSPDEQKVESNIESSDSNLLELNCNHLDLIPVCDRSDEKIISALKLDLGNFFQLESNIIPSTQEVEVNTPDTCKTLGDNDDTTCNDLL